MSYNKRRNIQFLKGLVKYRVASGVLPEVLEKILSSLDCPRALTIAILLRNKEYEQLVKLEFDPSHYNSLVSCRDAYAATKLLSKFDGFNLPYDLDEVALRKFDEFELLCKQTNARFRSLQHDHKYSGHVVWLHHAVIRKIERILGEYSPEEFFSRPDWGPGATTTIRRRDASPVNKFQCETGITRDLYAFMSGGLLQQCYPLWFSHLTSMSSFPTFETGNKVVTVPKDAKTNRVIAVEPGMNLWFQKSLGDMIERRLLRWGVDLHDQQRNQQLAKLGSRTNKLATVDLSSASDSISLEVVRELIPEPWFRLLDVCRSPYGSVAGSMRRWNKFSSMGNGFTFQLESLIFFAIALCCKDFLRCTGEVSVYGDDIILPSTAYTLFAELVDFYGFRINGSKSFFDSPFRESCGSHFYSGIDIKPIYIKSRLSSTLSIYRLANAIRRWSHRRNSFYGCDQDLRSSFDSLVQSVPGALRLRIPDILGDGGFVGNLDESAPVRAKHGVEGYRVEHVQEVSSSYNEERIGYLLSALWRLSKFEEGIIPPSEGRTTLQANHPLRPKRKIMGRNSVPSHHRLEVIRVVSVVQQWYNFGPWI